MSLALFTVVSACAYAVAVWLLWRHAPHLRSERSYVLLLAAAFPAFLVTLRFGQTSTVALLAVALAIWALDRRGRFLAGAALGLLAYKPHLLIVAVPTLILARDWRTCGGLLAAASAQLLLAWGAVGSSGLMRYAGTLATLGTRPDMVVLYPENSHSLMGFLRLLGMAPGWATAAAAGVLALAIPYLARAWRRDTPLRHVSALVSVTLLVTPHLLTYDLVLLAVPLAGLSDWALEHPRPPHTRWSSAVSVAMYLAPFSSVLAAHSRLQLSTLAIGAAALMLVRYVIPRQVSAPTGA
jgi:hypothetical protein